MQAIVHCPCHALLKLGQGELVLARHGGDLLLEACVVGLDCEIGHYKVFPEHRGCFGKEGTHLLGLAQTTATEEIMNHGMIS